MTGTDTSLNNNKTVKELTIFTEPLSSGHTRATSHRPLWFQTDNIGGRGGAGGEKEVKQQEMFTHQYNSATDRSPVLCPGL